MLSNNQLRVQKVQLCRTSVGNSCTKARSPLDHIIGMIFSLHTTLITGSNTLSIKTIAVGVSLCRVTPHIRIQFRAKIID